MRPRLISGRFKCSICRYDTVIYFDHFLFHLEKEKFIFVYRRDIAKSPGYCPQVARSKYYIKKYIYWNEVYVGCPKCQIASLAFNEFLFDDLTDFEKFVDDLEAFQMAPYRYVENGRVYVEFLSTKEIEQIMSDEQNQEEVDVIDHLSIERFSFLEVQLPRVINGVFITGKRPPKFDTVGRLAGRKPF